MTRVSTGTRPEAERTGRPAVPVVVNVAAGSRGRDSVGQVMAALAAAGVQARVTPVAPDEVAAAVLRERMAGAGMIGVAGGDGTVLAAAEMLAGTTTALAVLPAGTLNHFARRLGVPTLDGAAATLAAGGVSTVPLGVLDDRVFLNTATFGFYADVVRRRERYRGLIGKWGAAVVGFVLTLAQLRVMNVTLVLEGKRLERRSGLIWVGMGRGSFPLVHRSQDRRSHPDLEIVVLRPRGIPGTAALIVRSLLALRRREHPIRDAALEVLHARTLLIEGDRAIGVTLDGEITRCTPPILVALQDEGLRVVIPAAKDADDRRLGPDTE